MKKTFLIAISVLIFLNFFIFSSYYFKKEGQAELTIKRHLEEGALKQADVHKKMQETIQLQLQEQLAKQLQLQESIKKQVEGELKKQNQIQEEIKKQIQLQEQYHAQDMTSESYIEADDNNALPGLQLDKFFRYLENTRKKISDNFMHDFVSPVNIDYSKYTHGPTKFKSKYKTLYDPKGERVDFVIAVAATHCSIHTTAQLVNRYYHPRFIYFMVMDTSHCETIESWDTNIICVDEKKILPHGFTSDTIREMIKAKNDEAYFRPYNDIDVNSAYKRAGWYFLQFLNFGIGMYLKGISEHYVVWDSDIIPVENRRKFFTEDGKAIFYTQYAHGNFHINYGYHKSFEYLFGAEITHPPGQPYPIENYRKSEGWVTHQMIFKREFVHSMIRYIEFYHNIPKDTWMFLAVSTFLRKEMKNFMHFGFADYDMYGSWVHQVYPSTQKVLLQSYDHYIRDTTSSHYKKGTCCPPPEVFKEMKENKHIHYFLMEIHKTDKACSKGLNQIGTRVLPPEFEELI